MFDFLDAYYNFFGDIGIALGPWRWLIVIPTWILGISALWYVIKRRIDGNPIGQSRRRGFTLIEMSVVMVIVGLLTTMGLNMVKVMSASSRNTAAHGALTMAEQAIIAYAVGNTCLPCPADGSLASNATNAGVSLTAGGATYTGCVGITAGCWATNPVLPWKTLGLSETEASDPWAGRLTYVVSGHGFLSDCTTPVPVEEAGGFKLQLNTSVTPNVSCYPLGALTIQSVSGSVQTTQAVYVLVSHGPDRSDARAVTTGALIADSNNSANQTLNAGAGTTFVQEGFVSMGGTTHFDDIVISKTGPLAVRACGTNACGNGS